MEKPKRSYYLPGKLVDAFDKDCAKVQELVREYAFPSAAKEDTPPCATSPSAAVSLP